MYVNCCCFSTYVGDDEDGAVSMNNPLYDERTSENDNSAMTTSSDGNMRNYHVGSFDSSGENGRSSNVSSLSNAERTQPREGFFGAIKTLVNHRSKIFIHNDTSGPIYAKVCSADSKLPIILCVETIKPNEYQKIALTDSKCIVTIAKPVKMEEVDEVATANALKAVTEASAAGQNDKKKTKNKAATPPAPPPVMHTVEKICIFEENKLMKDRDVYKAQEKRYKIMKPIRTLTVEMWEKEIFQ